MAVSALLFSLAILFTQLQVGSSAQVNSVQTHDKRGHQHSLQKRGRRIFPGTATFFVPGLGACGQTNGPSDFIVALNANQFSKEQWCGKKIEISFGGKSTEAVIQDECPGCPFGGLDMSPSLFEFFANKDVGVFYMKWSLADDSSEEPAPPPKPSPLPPPPSPPPPPPPPHKVEEPPPPKKEETPPPAKTEPPAKDQPPPYQNPPQYTPTPTVLASSPLSTQTSSVGSGSNTVPNPVVQPNPITTTSSSGTTLTAGTLSSTNTIQSTVQTNYYAPSGNLDAINQLVISFGSLTAASAGNAINNQN